MIVDLRIILLVTVISRATFLLLLAATVTRVSLLYALGVIMLLAAIIFQGTDLTTLISSRSLFSRLPPAKELVKGSVQQLWRE